MDIRFRLLLLLMVCLLSVSTAGAESYSCRNSEGVLQFADSPADLPAECRDKAQKVQPDKLDTLTIVPAAPTSPASAAAPDQQTRTQEYEQHQTQIEKLQQRAEQLVKSYQAAVSTKREALRNWKYTSREKIKQADQQIAAAQKGKQQLLEELGTVKMLTEDEQKIRHTLDAISAQ